VKLFILSFYFFSTALSASTNPEGCGLYEINGVIEYSKADSSYIYIVNKGSLSEYRFLINLQDEIKIAPFIERSTKVRVRISEKLNGYTGKFFKIETLEYVAADPLLLKNSSNFSLVKKEKCEK
jgi:hypothetical protein